MLQFNDPDVAIKYWPLCFFLSEELEQIDRDLWIDRFVGLERQLARISCSAFTPQTLYAMIVDVAYMIDVGGAN